MGDVGCFRGNYRRGFQSRQCSGVHIPFAFSVLRTSHSDMSLRAAQLPKAQYEDGHTNAHYS